MGSSRTHHSDRVLCSRSNTNDDDDDDIDDEKEQVPMVSCPGRPLRVAEIRRRLGIGC